MKRSEVVTTARTYVGVPYRHQGRTRAGIDCIGLIWCIAADLGYRVDIPANYAQSPSSALLIEGCERTMVKQDRALTDLKPGDVVVMWGMTRAEAQHFAVVGQVDGRLTLIHAFSKHQKVVEQSIDEFWSRRFVAIYCFPGLED